MPPKPTTRTAYRTRREDLTERLLKAADGIGKAEAALRVVEKALVVLRKDPALTSEVYLLERSAAKWAGQIARAKDTRAACRTEINEIDAILGGRTVLPMAIAPAVVPRAAKLEPIAADGLNGWTIAKARPGAEYLLARGDVRIRAARVDGVGWHVTQAGKLFAKVRRIRGEWRTAWHELPVVGAELLAVVTQVAEMARREGVVR